jgi:hypothetical protein
LSLAGLKYIKGNFANIRNIDVEDSVEQNTISSINYKVKEMIDTQINIVSMTVNCHIPISSQIYVDEGTSSINITLNSLIDHIPFFLKEKC